MEKPKNRKGDHEINQCGTKQFEQTHFVKVGAVPRQRGWQHANNFAERISVALFWVHVINFRFKQTSIHGFPEPIQQYAKQIIRYVELLNNPLDK